MANAFNSLSDDQVIDRLLAKPQQFDNRRRPSSPIAAQTAASGRAGLRIPSLEALFALARRLVRDEAERSSGVDPSAVEQITAGGDPLGDCYMRLRAAEHRREAGITFTPANLVDAMLAWTGSGQGIVAPARIIDPGAGTGRFAIAAAARFPEAEIFAVENDPGLAPLLRANLRVLGLDGRVRVIEGDFRSFELPLIDRPTLFIGNPPYVRHHSIARKWKDWYAAACARYGIKASRLAGMHLHFFAKVAEIARDGDYGCFITAAEWLDVGYGAALRQLLGGRLGGCELHVLEPAAEAFPGTMTTAAITAFRVGARPAALSVRLVDKPERLNPLVGGKQVAWANAVDTPRWSLLTRDAPPRPPGTIELGEICAVHRGQVTGANRVWIASGPLAEILPDCVLRPTITSAAELIAAAPILEDDTGLARVVDLPADLDSLPASDRALVERFLAWAKRAGAADGYIARHRTPWWAVRLGAPAPIVCTYMGRRPPAFVRNRAGARLLNIAHGLYPRQPMSEDQLMGLVERLRMTVRQSSGRTYAGGLTKFEPRELERVRIALEEPLG